VSAFPFFALLSFITVAASAAELIPFAGTATNLNPGWKWLREDPSAWRITNGLLEVRVQPGNMWGPANNAKNVLIIPLERTNELEITATLQHRPTEQYEQADLVWYYADGNMVKLGPELVDGRFSVVMGREEGDRARTISINPIPDGAVDVKFIVKADQITGFYRDSGADTWKNAGSCSVPALPGVAPRLSLQFYQGPAKVEHWARVKRLAINATSEQQK
jgi:regulation of enolase protein 1 (concanavalin A-like superfamily)